MKNNAVKLFLLIFGDFLMLYGALFLALFLRYAPLGQKEWQLIQLHLTPFGFIFILWLFIFGSFGLYDLRLMRNNKRFFYRLANAVALGTVLAILILYFLVPFSNIEPRRNLIYIVSLALIILILWRFLFNFFIIKARGWRLLFWGINEEVEALAEYLLQHPQLGPRPVALLSANSEKRASQFPTPKTPELLRLGEDSDIEKLIKEYNIDTIVITREIKEREGLVSILFRVVPLGIKVFEFTKFYEIFTGKIPLSLVDKVWFLENLVGAKKQTYEFFKRVLDVLTALIIGIPAALLFPFIALAIKLDSEGPIFYRQKRVGRHGTIFELMKYRTMVKDAEKFSGFKGKAKNDPRNTRVGFLLRRSYFDEIPQIINILKGEMSFVGPRPERPEYVTQLKNKIPFYEMRLLVPPGITGWAQVRMENDASVEDAPEKMQYDLYYIKNRSFMLDLLIILRTIFTLLRRQGR